MSRYAVERVSIPLLLAVALAVFIAAPGILDFGDTTIHWWYNAAWTISPLIAAFACFRTAKHCKGSDQKAWRDFGFAGVVWCVGTLYWEYFDLQGIEPPFPSPADAGYVLACILYITGIYHFVAQPRINRLQLCNFALILSASAVGVFRILYPSIDASSLDLFSVLVALSYPIAWIGTVVFGIVCLALYVPRRKSWIGAIIVASLVAQAIAGLFYGLALLGADYEVGSLFDSFWPIGFALTAWAAVEQHSRDALDANHDDIFVRTKWQHIGEAFVPVGAVAMLVISDIASATFVKGSFYLLMLPIGVAFIAILAIREYYSLQIERDLRIGAEENAGRLAESQQRLAAVLESTSDSIIVLDRDWRITYCNGQALSAIEGDKALKVGLTLWEIFPEAVGTAFDLNYRKAMETQRPVEFEEYLPSIARWFDVHAYPSQDGLSIFFRDATERRMTGETLTYLAEHDSLTGLYNRRRFTECLTKVLPLATMSSQTALLCIDLDEFKEVNDSLGHPAGDAVLKITAERLRECVGPKSYLTRLGGDEFAIIAEGISNPQDAADLAELILTSLRKPLEIAGQTLHIGASMGLVLAPYNGSNSEELFKKADIALYSAKTDGRNVYRFFDQGMADRVAVRQSLKNDLVLALGKDQFHLAFQPITDLRNNRITAFETLLRWSHPTRGPISPSSFIPLAEETGIITEIGDWVLENACREAMQWPAHIGIAVNLSPVQFRNPTLPLRVAAALGNSGLSPSRLELEITESVLLHDSESNLTILHELRKLGVRIALDDFGTGYSSLSYLHKFPFNKLKIDRSFVMDIVERPEAKEIVRATTSLGHALGITITVEGVETRQHVDVVSALGCDQAQGYFFSRPIPASDVRSTVKAFDSDDAPVSARLLA